MPVPKSCVWSGESWLWGGLANTAMGQWGGGGWGAFCKHNVWKRRRAMGQRVLSVHLVKKPPLRRARSTQAMRWNVGDQNAFSLTAEWMDADIFARDWTVVWESDGKPSLYGKQWMKIAFFLLHLSSWPQHVMWIGREASSNSSPRWCETTLCLALQSECFEIEAFHTLNCGNWVLQTIVLIMLERNNTLQPIGMQMSRREKEARKGRCKLYSVTWSDGWWKWI